MGVRVGSECGGSWVGEPAVVLCWAERVNPINAGRLRHHRDELGRVFGIISQHENVPVGLHADLAKVYEVEVLLASTHYRNSGCDLAFVQ